MTSVFYSSSLHLYRLGIPFRVTENRTTGGWVGPLNIILAKNFTAEEEEDVNSHVIDRYETRYIQTPMSPFIMMSPNMTLLAPEDFQNYFGPKAISSTAQVQAETIDDFYAPFFETCDNGDVHPILPLYQFEFVRDPQTGNETIDVRLDYKILTIPDENTHAWKWMPTLAKRGLPVKGPYCYGMCIAMRIFTRKTMLVLNVYAFYFCFDTLDLQLHCFTIICCV